MPSNKKKGRKLHLSNGGIYAISLLMWLALTILISNLAGYICKNCSTFFYEISLWIGKAINTLIAFNILAMAEIFTTPVKIKAVTQKPVTFSRYELLYKRYVKNIAPKTVLLDNLFKKASLFRMCKTGRYLGFLLLKYLK